MKDETFYVVAATVIPVYFLALTLQGTFYEKIRTYFESYTQKSLDDWQTKFLRVRTTDRQFVRSYLRTRPYAFVTSLALTLAALAIILSAAAEAFALLALYNGYAYQYADAMILSALLVLTIGTAALILARLYTPAVIFIFRVMILVWRKARKTLPKEGRAPEDTSQIKETK